MPRMKKPAATPAEFHETVSLKRLAGAWDMPRRQVRRLVQQGRLPFVEVMGQIRVPANQAKPRD